MSPILTSDATLTPAETAAILKRPPSFAYFGDKREEMFKTWAYGPVIRMRDSSLLQQVNADALIAHLQSDESLADDWTVERASHWGVGWVEHLSYRVIESDGTPTRIARVLKDWFERLKDYPVADEDALSERELEATLDNVRQVGKRYVSDDAPEDWEVYVRRWLEDNEPGEVEARDGGGGYPSDESVIRALESLGYLDPESVEE